MRRQWETVSGRGWTQIYSRFSTGRVKPVVACSNCDSTTHANQDHPHKQMAPKGFRRPPNSRSPPPKRCPWAPDARTKFNTRGSYFARVESYEGEKSSNLAQCGLINLCMSKIDGVSVQYTLILAMAATVNTHQPLPTSRGLGFSRQPPSRRRPTWPLLPVTRRPTSRCLFTSTGTI
jgi:hypothetical protein